MRSLKISNTITRRDQKSLNRYLNDISKYDVLTPEEEVDLFKQFKGGDEHALTLLIRHNLRFVVSVAKQYQHLGFWLGDLVNEGNIGLIKAARRFDDTRGFKFISYAVWWIRQSILLAINEKSKKIKVPSNINSQTTKVMSKMSEILQRKERKATVSELAAATDLSEVQVQRCLKSYQRCQSIDAPLSADSENSMASLMEDDSLESPDFNLAVKESQQIEVNSILTQLPERQATILKMSYGLNQKEPMTLEDIGNYLGISRERVRQIRDRAISRLRRRVNANGLTFATA